MIHLAETPLYQLVIPADTCVTVCGLCLSGAGGFCNVPECLFIRMAAPDLSLRARLEDSGASLKHYGVSGGEVSR